MNTMEHFVPSYALARKRFLQMAERHADAVRSFPLPDAVGVDGEVLAIDAARFGPPDAKTLLLCVSGTHGAEGYAGSAVQRDWIARTGGQLPGAPSGIAVWMIHAVNPYGFSHGLRNNEDNVDLNRNWIDFAKPLPENPQYADLADVLDSRTIDPSTFDQAAQTIDAFATQHGLAHTESVLTQGQYDIPTTPSFGGAAPAFSRLAIETLIREEMSKAQRVAYVDFHSGTVGCGDTIFLCFSPPRSDAFARAASWWGADNLNAATVEQKWGGQRPDRHGLMFWGVEAAFGAEAEVAGAVIEFGTLEPDQRAEALWSGLLESYLRSGRVQADAQTDAIRARVRRAFDRTGDAVWERAVLENGDNILRAALDGAISWHKEGQPS